MGEDGRHMNRRILPAIGKTDIKAIALGTLLILLLETYYIITTPGTTLYVFIVDSLLSIAVMLIVASFYISERNKTEKTIRESEEKYRSLVEDVPDIIYTLDRNGNFTSVNEHALKVLGYQKDELIGQHFVKVIHPDDVEMTLESFKKAVFTKKQKPRGLMFRLLAKDRRVIWVSLNSSMTFDEGGRVLQEQGVARDITERKRAEEELRQYRDHLEKLIEERTAELRKTNEQLEQDIIERKRAEEALMESEERLRQLIEYAPDAIYINDLNGNFVDGNRQAEKMIGYKKEELVGKNMVEVGLLPEKHVAKALEASEKALRGQRFGPEEFELIRKDGKWISVEISSFPVKRERKVEVINIARDITERKQMEERLRESEERFKNLYESIKDPLVVWVGREGRLIEYNKAFKEQTGYTDEELKEKTFLDFIHPDDHAMVLEKFRTKYSEEDFPLVYEIRALNKKGEIIPLEISVSPYKVKGKVIGVEAIGRDITERKRADNAIRESEEKWRSLVELAPDGILTFNMEGVVTSVNTAFLRLTGFSEDKIVGKQFTKLGTTQARDIPKFLKLFSSAVRGKIHPPVEFAYRRKDGTTGWSETHGCLMKTGDKTIGIQTIVRDTTKRKQMEEKLRQYSEHLEELVQKRTEELLESEKRYSVLVEEASDAVAILQDAKIVFVNKKAQEIISYSKDELIGLPYEKLVDEKYRQYAKELYMGRLRGETIPATAEIELTAKTGERVPVELSGTLLNYQGRPAVLIIVRDIRERKRMEEQHLKLEKLAAIGEAATMVGHDLRNPLQSIEIATSYLNDELSRLSSTSIPQEATKMLQLLSNSVDYADKIVRELQDFASTKKPMLGKTDVNAIVKDVLSQVEVTENVNFITELGRLPRIEADKDMIKRVLLNLATNGIQAMENGGTLKVSTKKMRDFVEVSFKDTGVGIPKENMKKLFTPFFTTRAKGMGMGLPICKKFVDAHGGNIEVESEEGKGSTFTVKLPIQ